MIRVYTTYPKHYIFVFSNGDGTLIGTNGYGKTDVDDIVLEEKWITNLPVRANDREMKDMIKAKLLEEKRLTDDKTNINFAGGIGDETADTAEEVHTVLKKINAI